MQEGGARLIEKENGNQALIGIGKVFPEGPEGRATPDDRRKGEMLARAAIVELTGDVEISSARGSGEKGSLSAFFQVTTTRVQAEIQQLPVIGTWWSADRQTFFVAVGKIITSTDSSPVQLVDDNVSKHAELPEIEGEEPFVSLLRASPVLMHNGGVRGFVLPDGRKVVMSVASAPINGNLAKAHRIARLKAVRNLLGQQNGIQVSSVEYLADHEQLSVAETGGRYVLLSEFFSVQTEHVAGKIQAMPVVAEWNLRDSKMINYVIGKLIN